MCTQSVWAYSRVKKLWCEDVNKKRCMSLLPRCREIVQQCYTLPPRESIRKFRRKVLSLTGRRSVGDTFDLDEVFASSKELRASRMMNFLWRYERIVQRQFPQWKLDFVGKRVLEIGGGPLLGFGPVAVFFGCTEYVNAEPFHNPAILEHPKATWYFTCLYNDLSAVFGPRMTRHAFLDALADRAHVDRTPIEMFTSERPFDVVLSNSTLEHIRDLDRALSRLRAASTPEIIFLHLVDFGNHRDPMQPFRGVYVQPKDAYIAARGDMINLLRPCDVLERFERNGFRVAMVPYYSWETLPDPVHEWWASRYTREQLLMKAVLFCNRPAHRVREGEGVRP